MIPGLCCIFYGAEKLPASITCTWRGRGGEHVLWVYKAFRVEASWSRETRHPERRRVMPGLAWLYVCVKTEIWDFHLCFHQCASSGVCPSFLLKTRSPYSYLSAYWSLVYNTDYITNLQYSRCSAVALWIKAIRHFVNLFESGQWWQEMIEKKGR